MKNIRTNRIGFPQVKLLLFAGCLAILSACSKDDDQSIPPEQLLAGNTSKTWQIERISSFGVADDPQPCSADDEFTFFSNQEFLYNDKEIKCDENSPNMIEGTWTLNNEENTIAISAGPFAGTADIEDLSAERLRITTRQAGAPITITFRPK